MSYLSAHLQDIAALPADRPMTMPGAFYTSQEQFDREAATVLRRGWHCLGRVDEIPNAGDFFTVQLLTEPLIVVRQGDGDIAVLANVCRHRQITRQQFCAVARAPKYHPQHGQQQSAASQH